MTTAITPAQPAALAARDDQPFFTPEDLALIRRTVARDANDDEFSYFVKIASLRRLNPLVQQIALQIRSKDNPDKRTATIITTIHGLRLIAERTGRYAPGHAATFTYDSQGQVESATAYVLKYHPASNTWHEVSDTAYFTEYVQEYWNKDAKRNEPSGLWGTKPRVMLAKCAEALAIRRAFPEDTTGLYTDDELSADTAPAADPVTGEIVDGAVRPLPTATRPAAPSRPAAAKPLPAPAPTPARPAAMTRIQRANLVQRYAELYGCDETAALAGLDGLFSAQFGHGLDQATYNEGAAVTAHLLNLQRQAKPAEPTDTAPTASEPDVPADARTAVKMVDYLNDALAARGIAFRYDNHIHLQNALALKTWKGPNDTAFWNDVRQRGIQHAANKMSLAA